MGLISNHQWHKTFTDKETKQARVFVPQRFHLQFSRGENTKLAEN
jgi:hypothetical protein